MDFRRLGDNVGCLMLLVVSLVFVLILRGLLLLLFIVFIAGCNVLLGISLSEVVIVGACCCASLLLVE